MLCPNCFTRCQKNAVLCGRCRTKIGGDTSETELPLSQAESEPVRSKAEPSEPLQGKKGGQKKKIGGPGIVLILFLTLGLGGLGATWLGPSPSPSEFTVTFYLNDDTVVVFGEPVVVAARDTVAVPTPAPYRSGYAFLHWTRDQIGNDPFDFSTPITGRLVLYAQWE